MLSDHYHDVRRRVSRLVATLSPDDLAAPVPACPAWDGHDLVAHMSGIPDELGNGRYPQGDLQAWLDSIVVSRRSVPVADLLASWEATVGRIEPIVDGSGGMLLVDIAAHENDLLGALGRPGARDAAEVGLVMALALDLLKPGIEQAGLAALAIDTGSSIVASHEGHPGCTIETDAWTAFRALESRRTADELRALPHTGDIAPYIAVIAAHSPLPDTSLSEG